MVSTKHEENAWQRCLSKREVDDAGCWITQHARNAAGYGYVTVGSRPDSRIVLIHRLSVAIALGVSVSDMSDWCDSQGSMLEVDHLCRVRACFNPDHLELVDHRTNALRGISFSAKNGARRECVNGHRFTGANVATAGLAIGRRRCVTCERIRGIIRSRRVTGSKLSLEWDVVERQVLGRDPLVALDALGGAA